MANKKEELFSRSMLARPEGPEDAHPQGQGGRRLGRIHDRILDVLAQVEAGVPADKALRTVFNKARDLGSKERHQVSDTVYGYLRRYRRVDDTLTRAMKAIRRPLDTIDPPVVTRLKLLTYLALIGANDADLKATDAYAQKRVPGLFDKILSGKLGPPKGDTAEVMAIELSLPTFLVRRLLATYGSDRTQAIAQALEGRAPLTLRANRLLISRDELQDRLQTELNIKARPTPWSPDGLILPPGAQIREWRGFEDGLCELQDEGSQLIALATGARPGLSVLDACAGAGGKTLGIAALMARKGRLLAIDPDEKKLEELKKRLRRADVPNGEVKASDLEHLDPELHGRFDIVLLDAPCTGLGTLRRNPDLVLRSSEADLVESVARQKRLLVAAILALKPGGRLVYATCSVVPDENEGVIHNLLAHDERVRPLPLATTWGPELAEGLKASYEVNLGPGPTEDGPDGFYVALLERV